MTENALLQYGRWVARRRCVLIILVVGRTVEDAARSMLAARARHTPPRVTRLALTRGGPLSKHREPRMKRVREHREVQFIHKTTKSANGSEEILTKTETSVVEVEDLPLAPRHRPPAPPYSVN